MKKYYLFFTAFLFASACFAQIENENHSIQDTAKIIKRPPPPPPPPPAPEVEKIFRVIENPPRFLRSECERLKTKQEIRACAEQAFTEFIYEQLEYPEEAFKKRIEGNVFAEFMVDKNGNVKDPKIIIDIGGDCGEEVLRIIGNLPKFKPNPAHGGRPSLVKKQIVVHFDRKAWKRKLKAQAKKE